MKSVQIKVVSKSQEKIYAKDLQSADQIYMDDHMPPVESIHINVDGVSCYFKNSVIDILNKYNVDYSKKQIVTNHYIKFEDFPNMQMDIDNMWIFQCFLLEFNKLYPSWEISFDDRINKHLTFMVNKPREHRILCSSVLANYFDENTISYSFSSVPRAKLILQELLLDTNYDLNLNKILTDNWYVHDKNYEKFDQSIGAHEYKSNTEVFANCLYNQIYKNSATSIITEPNFFENGAAISEKTAMAVFSGHFMIWPGTWKVAEAMQSIGLDVFDDIIDHSYQYIEHPGKRVVEAITRNLDFLQDIEKQKETRLQLRDRLTKNFEFLRDVNKVKEKLKSLNDKYTKLET